MKYKVVEKRTIYDIEIEVNSLIKDGWKPLGGIGYSDGYNYGEAYVQAMIFGGEK